MDKSKFRKIYFLSIIVLFLTVLFPVFQLGNKAYPITLGLPFSFFWVIMWIVITFLIVFILHRLDPDKKEE
ncbi:glucan phosphoethanolaminetransferase (alkaline phosphatase superfamily) [Caldalkalibacillus uzonensis]|uniref:Glucan phosphoethanolaminetransferase (Alkaline phosphatase superfamily) n=1 Tax=Caldalkalibacillus uzonensis TaxID=353224 RepID=A0ABU0CUJ2_9BACI|nr:hypothetical protein [Caldalkalibacillus uzonensis]MDQ0338687.1 glucan phosphoethanolaminetransferase (alkaline phosphatase superfamily) [Caldalkalibacillus uzonensis]